MWDFESVGLPALRNEFTALENSLDDPEAFLALVKSEVGADVRRNFEQGGRPLTWPDITARSRAERKVNTASGPLIDSGALMDAASDTEGGADGSLFQIAGDTLTLGTDLAYAATQQYGRPARGGQGGGIAARPYEAITPEDEVRIAAAFEGDYLHRLLAGSTVL